MKSKILGLLAVGLLAGSVAANAAYLYTFSSSADPTASLSFTTPDFLTATGMLPIPQQTLAGLTINQGALSVCDGFATFTFTTGDLSDLQDCNLSLNGFQTFSKYLGVPQGLGSYAASQGAGNPPLPYLERLTITAVASVPEPGTLALLGLGLVGLGLSRRRKAA